MRVVCGKENVLFGYQIGAHQKNTRRCDCNINELLSFGYCVGKRPLPAIGDPIEKHQIKVGCASNNEALLDQPFEPSIGVKSANGATTLTRRFQLLQ